MILLYSDTPRRLWLALQPASILGPVGLVDRGRVSLAIEGAPVATADVQVGRLTMLPLEIATGFTRVTLRLESGAHVPAEVIAGSGDTRRVSLALSKIELSDE